MSAPFSSTSKKVFIVYGVVIFTNLLVLGLSARVNHFQDYFFVADLFPLALSIITVVLSVLMLLLDVGFNNSFTARPPFYIGLLFVLSVFWLAFNAFSTSRWRHIPLNCSSIPADYPDVKSWCTDLQVLKSFVWINWLIIFLSALFTVRFAMMQHSNGQKHIWRVPLSRFAKRMGHQRNNTVSAGMTEADRNFLQFSR
ncbi:hypothetical protein BV25DRAFT_1832723 [Artomyces pyxidatus]|uniref:Uncharacterized protein n=1 Tax=Artomyces pyxidatus TaxID=48021 RepID=A0ACB8SIR5_9AGAM|nr:hypothetical protein BV25DRAFT_1832723 [Artomyces pyxidatus]